MLLAGLPRVTCGFASGCSRPSLGLGASFFLWKGQGGRERKVVTLREGAKVPKCPRVPFPPPSSARRGLSFGLFRLVGRVAARFAASPPAAFCRPPSPAQAALSPSPLGNVRAFGCSVPRVPLCPFSPSLPFLSLPPCPFLYRCKIYICKTMRRVSNCKL